MLCASVCMVVTPGGLAVKLQTPGSVRQNPGELVACDLCAAPSQVLQIRGADLRGHDPYKFPFTPRLVDIDDLHRGRSVAHCLHQMSSPD